MSCFWTDLIGCIEDCSDAPVPGGFAFWGSYGAGATRQDRQYAIVLGATFADVLSDCALTLSVFPDVSLKELTLYQIDGAGCEWKSTMPAAHGETADSLLDGSCDGNTVWKPESFYAASATQSVSSSSLNYPLANVDDGYGPSACISLFEMFTLLGLPTDMGGSGAWIGTFRDNTTGLLYRGSGVLHTCY